MRVIARQDRRQFSLSLLIAIFALLFQSLITGSHVHADAVSGSTRVAAVTAFSHPAPSKSGECVICREIAQAGQYVSSASPQLTFSALPGFWLAPTVARSIAHRVFSHTWQSRGPPQVAPL